MYNSFISVLYCHKHYLFTSSDKSQLSKNIMNYVIYVQTRSHGNCPKFWVFQSKCAF